MEREAYTALVDKGRILSYLVGLGFDVLENPNKYKDIKDIVLYWQLSLLTSESRLLFIK
jgi:hypothetical protein